MMHQVAAGREYPPELARLYGDEATSAEPYALFDPYQGESLRDVGAYLSADFDQFMAGLLTGLCWLAGAGIAHRSISPDTVLWDSSAGQVQITDFSRSAPFGIARTPLRGPEAWTSPESRPETCSGMVGPTDDMWGAVRLLYFVRSNGNILTHRDQLAEFGLAETFSGMLGRVIGPPEGRPTARDLIVDGMRRPHLLPGVVDSRKSLIAGRAKFLNARGRKYRDGLGPPVPEGFWDDVVWPPARREATGPSGGSR
jgi:serine/threonine protein kinase